MPPAPYVSPYFDVTFYPEDVSFAALSKTIRASCRTFELFDIAKTVIGKNDRFVVVLERKPAAKGAEPAEKRPFYVSLPDGMPFESEDAAINHIMQHHVEKFFRAEQVEVDPPKGSFQVINRCGVTGELLGPPNYHLYSQICQQHHASRLSRMPFETFRNRIESVREQEVVDAWLEMMKKVTRYTWALDGAPKPAETPAAPTAPAAEAAPEAAEAPAPEGEATEAPAAEESAVSEAAAPAAPAAPSFDSLTEAKVYLLSHARDKAVRTYEHGRFHGNIIEKMPDGEIKRAVVGALERQQRFPLDTANALRGRLRREGFTIFKKGSKGISYVCAVKRKFRVPGQTFADSIDELINFIETHSMVKVSELPDKFLGLTPVAEATAAPVAPEAPAAAPATETTPPEEPAAAEETAAEAETPAPEAAAPAAAEAPAPAATGTTSPFAPDDQPKIKRMQLDLRWLVTEGYVTEFIDGSLFAAPPMPEAKPKPQAEPAKATKPAAAAEAAADVDESEAETEPEAVPDEPAAAPETESEPEAEKKAAEAAPAEPAPTPTAEEPAAETAEPPAETDDEKKSAE